ncbi:Uncharacterized protein FWK35_00002238 [Aphis craccivora]|uniref:Uncharacterized protein n=1 Tax=Aphis craccivora TaxID=307492 RepID=A0A6G0ZRU8_APHCR|nr:Uncharacterized protein FWK35_00002238 [Aphis craccivora]
MRCFSFSVSDFASISAPTIPMSLFIIVGTLTKEASRINGSVAQDYFNDDHMFARQITSKINAIP